MPKCIYCLHDKPSSDFNREHVIPKLLGTFKQNLTLHNAVCRDCNQYFGDNLEPVLAEGSIEGIRRLEYKIKHPENAQYLKNERIKLKWLHSGEWYGVVMRFIEKDDKLAVTLSPQVGFKHTSESTWKFYAKDELIKSLEKLEREHSDNTEIVVIADSEAKRKELIEILKSSKIGFTEIFDKPIPKPEENELSIKILASIDDLVLRCVAKISFNYLVKQQGTELVFDSSFNSVRDFVRKGTKPSYDLVVFDETPLLRDDRQKYRQTNGHLVTINWTCDSMNIVGQVSLLNEIRYRISLARNYPGIWRDIRKGHHFNIESGIIEELLGTSLYTP